MAALLTFVKVVRTVRERARAVTELLPKTLSGPLQRPEQEVAAFFEEIGLSGPASPRQAEAMIATLYERIELLENRVRSAGITKIFQRRAVAALRDAVVDLELLLIPEREMDFRLLGVSRRDGVGTVKTKFRALARKHHPDIHGGDTKRMEELNRAYKLVLRMRGVHSG